MGFIINIKALSQNSEGPGQWRKNNLVYTLLVFGEQAVPG